MLRFPINVQDVSSLGNGQLLYIQRVKKWEEKVQLVREEVFC